MKELYTRRAQFLHKLRGKNRRVIFQLASESVWKLSRSRKEPLNCTDITLNHNEMINSYKSVSENRCTC